MCVCACVPVLNISSQRASVEMDIRVASGFNAGLALMRTHGRENPEISGMGAPEELAGSDAHAGGEEV